MAKKTIVLKPGEKFILPKGSSVDALIIDGSISVESSCNDLPTPSSYKCGSFFIIVDNDNNGDHSMDEEATFYKSLSIGGIEYSMPTRIIKSSDDPGNLSLASDLNLFITDQITFKFLSVIREIHDKRQHVFVHFTVPEYLWDTVVLAVNNRESIQYYLPFAEMDCDDIPSES
jgi:hypothetical protein